MKNCNLILTERQQTYQLYNLTGGEILLSNQSKIIEQVKFTYSPLGKAFEKQTNTIESKEERKNML